MRGLWDAAQFRFTVFIDSENPFLDRIVSRDALLFMIYQISRPVLMGVKVFTDSRGWFKPPQFRFEKHTQAEASERGKVMRVR